MSRPHVLRKRETFEDAAAALGEDLALHDAAALAHVVIAREEARAELHFALRGEGGNTAVFRFALGAADCGQLSIALEAAERQLLNATRRRRAMEARFAC